MYFCKNQLLKRLHTRLECGRSWVWALIGSNQRL